MLIRSEEIYKKANRIVKTCGTRDTLKIARELGIYVHFIDELLASGDHDHILSGVFNQFLSEKSEPAE